MIYVLGRLFRYLWSAVSPCNEFCDRILSIPLLPRTIKLTAFILCLLLCVMILMKLIFSSQPFLLYSILKHRIPRYRCFVFRTKIFTSFMGVRETSQEQVALISFTSIVLYSIYDYSSLANVPPGFSTVEHKLVKFFNGSLKAIISLENHSINHSIDYLHKLKCMRGE